MALEFFKDRIARNMSHYSSLQLRVNFRKKLTDYAPFLANLTLLATTSAFMDYNSTLGSFKSMKNFRSTMLRRKKTKNFSISSTQKTRDKLAKSIQKLNIFEQ